MKRVILTGGSGFVGANLARRLVRDGHELHLFLRPEHSDWRIRGIQTDLRAHRVDLHDADRIHQNVAAIRPDWIFNLATYGAYPDQTDERRMVQTNVFGAMNLVNASLQRGCEAFINTGSSSEYGLKDHAPSEDENLAPNSAYAVTKAAATRYCQDVGRTHAANIQTLRLYSVYGPWEEPGRLIPTLISRGVNGELPALANPETARDFVFVDDAVDAYLLAASAGPLEPGGIYNVGTGVQTSLREAVDVARRVFDITAEPEWGTLPARAWDTDVWVADNSKFRNRFAWRPRFDFERGFRATVEWFKSHPEIWSAATSRVLFPSPQAERG
ncbi:MAG TPA: NAD-dependent epimerase/dehydratase family protein [Pyrinomonadaceae bacterium]